MSQLAMGLLLLVEDPQLVQYGQATGVGLSDSDIPDDNMTEFFNIKEDAEGYVTLRPKAEVPGGSDENVTATINQHPYVSDDLGSLRTPPESTIDTHSQEMLPYCALAHSAVEFASGEIARRRQNIMNLRSHFVPPQEKTLGTGDQEASVRYPANSTLTEDASAESSRRDTFRAVKDQLLGYILDSRASTSVSSEGACERGCAQREGLRSQDQNVGRDESIIFGVSNSSRSIRNTLKRSAADSATAGEDTRSRSARYKKTHSISQTLFGPGNYQAGSVFTEKIGYSGIGSSNAGRSVQTMEGLPSFSLTGQPPSRSTQQKPEYQHHQQRLRSEQQADSLDWIKGRPPQAATFLEAIQRLQPHRLPYIICALPDPQTHIDLCSMSGQIGKITNCSDCNIWRWLRRSIFYLLKLGHRPETIAGLTDAAMLEEPRKMPFRSDGHRFGCTGARTNSYLGLDSKQQLMEFCGECDARTAITRVLETFIPRYENNRVLIQMKSEIGVVLKEVRESGRCEVRERT